MILLSLSLVTSLLDTTNVMKLRKVFLFILVIFKAQRLALTWFRVDLSNLCDLFNIFGIRMVSDTCPIPAQLKDSIFFFPIEVTLSIFLKELSTLFLSLSCVFGKVFFWNLMVSLIHFDNKSKLFSTYLVKAFRPFSFILRILESFVMAFEYQEWLSHKFEGISQVHQFSESHVIAFLYTSNLRSKSL